MSHGILFLIKQVQPAPCRNVFESQRSDLSLRVIFIDRFHGALFCHATRFTAEPQAAASADRRLRDGGRCLGNRFLRYIFLSCNSAVSVWCYWAGEAKHALSLSDVAQIHQLRLLWLEPNLNYRCQERDQPVAPTKGKDTDHILDANTALWILSVCKDYFSISMYRKFKWPVSVSVKQWCWVTPC